MPTDIKLFSKYSRRNKVYIDNSDQCGCYFCQSIFEPKDIKEWTDNGETAICPECHVDSVIGNSVINFDKKVLEEAGKHWFW